MTHKPFFEDLATIVGEEAVSQDDGRRRLFATDAYLTGAMPLAVVRPSERAQVAPLVRLARTHGLDVAVRGGGASYTGGYIPRRADTLSLDLGGLDQIVRIAATDGHVIVEPGVTWSALYRALAESGVRTPFYGPLSGLISTVGGAVSQNAVSLGSGLYGAAADSVLALEVVTASGDVIRTGGLGSATGEPFLRGYGPDLTGPFLGDCGALGIKTLIALRTIAARPYANFVSYGFDNVESFVAGMAAAARAGVAATNFGTDAAMVRAQLASYDAAAKRSMARAMLTAAHSRVLGLSRVVRAALASRDPTRGSRYAAHFVVEGLAGAATHANARTLSARLAAVGGRRLAPAMPAIMHAIPFLHYPVLGPTGNRGAPIHGIVPFSRGATVMRSIDRLLADAAGAMHAAGIEHYIMYQAVSSGGLLIEPVLNWAGGWTEAHRALCPPGYLEQLSEAPRNAAAEETVRELRARLIDLFHAHGAVHYQVGQTYPLRRERDPGALEMLDLLVGRFGDDQDLDGANLFAR